MNLDQLHQQHTDQLHASAVRFLMDGGEEKAAMILLSCTLRYDQASNMRSITLTAPRAIYDVLTPLNDSSNYAEAETLAMLPEKFQICAAIMNAFFALLGTRSFPIEFTAMAILVNTTEQWREELLALLRGDTVTNQGLPLASHRPVLTWNNLRFRSQTEIRIAHELDRRKVLFLPNCLARLGLRERQNREADFLICAEGKWGILEVDGDLAHPPTRTAEDHERDRLFQAHGILLAQHFAASECWENADGVVTKFLALLRQTR
jgi:hypothetical protein